MKPTTFGLNIKKLTELLQIGEDTPPDKTTEDHQVQKADTLNQWLRAKLPPEALPTKTALAQEEVLSVEALRDTPVGELLQARATVDVMIALKEYAKEKVACAEGDVERDVATILYYAGIAGALVFHAQMITSQSVEQLHEALTKLADQSWIRNDIQNLYEKARQVCSKRMPSGP